MEKTSPRLNSLSGSGDSFFINKKLSELEMIISVRSHV